MSHSNNKNKIATIPSLALPNNKNETHTIVAKKNQNFNDAWLYNEHTYLELYIIH